MLLIWFLNEVIFSPSKLCFSLALGCDGYQLRVDAPIPHGLNRFAHIAFSTHTTSTLLKNHSSDGISCSGSQYIHCIGQRRLF